MTGPPQGGDHSPADLLVLHAVRVAGMSDGGNVSRRTGLDQDTVGEVLGDFEACGWVTWVDFAGTGGWTLTDRGRAQDNRRLAEELDDSGTREAVEVAHRGFGPLNARLVRACTDWQLRPRGTDRLAVNDHSDPRWDACVLAELAALDRDLKGLTDDLVRSLLRFGGYQEQFSVALTRARSGQQQWVAGIGVASCHAVWMELHEDLLSTLGIARHAEPERA